MTYTQPNTDIDISIIPGEDSAVMAKKMQAAGQIQIARDIARLKAMGEPIYYEIGNKLEENLSISYRQMVPKKF
jgi:predicted DNA-binding transcriptional regulator YafY